MVKQTIPFGVHVFRMKYLHANRLTLWRTHTHTFECRRCVASRMCGVFSSLQKKLFWLSHTACWIVDNRFFRKIFSVEFSVQSNWNFHYKNAHAQEKQKRKMFASFIALIYLKRTEKNTSQFFEIDLFSSI